MECDTKPTKRLSTIKVVWAILFLVAVGILLLIPGRGNDEEKRSRRLAGEWVALGDGFSMRFDIMERNHGELSGRGYVYGADCVAWTRDESKAGWALSGEVSGNTAVISFSPLPNGHQVFCSTGHYAILSNRQFGVYLLDTNLPIHFGWLTRRQLWRWPESGPLLRNEPSGRVSRQPTNEVTNAAAAFTNTPPEK